MSMSFSGNFLLYSLTNKQKFKLRVELETFDGKRSYAEYLEFVIGSPNLNYILMVSGYSGTAGI